MQTQYGAVVALHGQQQNQQQREAFGAYPSFYPPNYLAGVNFTHGFLGGSSQSYALAPDGLYRGGPAYRASATTSGEEFDATGLGFSGGSMSGSLFAGEDAAPGYFGDAGWSWAEEDQQQQEQAQGLAHGVVAPVPMLPAPPEVSFLAIKSKGSAAAAIVRSPGPPLPTPAAMAVLLNGRSRSDGGQGGYDDGSAGAAAAAAAMPVPVPVPAPQPSVVVPENSTSREKKHACTMCHKRFDRPSTLRKHLLVHTGEKGAWVGLKGAGERLMVAAVAVCLAFVCEICGRRFGVASNLNRHVKRCVLKPVNMAASSKSCSESASGGEDAGAGSSPQASPVATSPEMSPPAQKRPSVSLSASSSPPQRGRAPPSISSSASSPLFNDPIPTTTTSSSNGAKPAKRRRRAPSPSRWVPLSLLQFNLISDDFYRTVQVPMPPVRRCLPKEERDSWDENTSPRPYHPESWDGVLPGPGLPQNQGLKPREASKLNFGSGGSASAFMVGRILVF
ncbi:hypothetical protein FA15DRAFT_446538 [Coprinopsis marcescibilis]|uniref:C2H2-type domain-containing protein n=1 Tax=Coprinopsis marcescibilis TaxID=230819 RepID=A0A5C3KT16_COPMA|nr:hypothetical protein FA15DRAFT_446538 [Coprinopsis marcescibilis]